MIETGVVVQERISAVVPTIGRVDTLPTVLTAIAFQTLHIDEFILLDEAAEPVTSSEAVQLALDVLSLHHIDVHIIRNRMRNGIGSARYRLVEEAKYDRVLMIDDDVVLRPNCLETLITGTPPEYAWTVPTCFLIPATFSGGVIDGYSDKLVNPDDAKVQAWINKYPWFKPYFRYSRDFSGPLSVSGTQCILLDRNTFLDNCSEICRLGKLPREDTYMTVKMGMGYFVSDAECLHYEHMGQVDRGNWERSMFYRLHEAIIENPDVFIEFIGK